MCVHTAILKGPCTAALEKLHKALLEGLPPQTNMNKDASSNFCHLDTRICRVNMYVMRCFKGHNGKWPMCQNYHYCCIAMIVALKTSHHILYHSLKTVKKNHSDISMVNVVSPAFLQTMVMAKVPNYYVTIGV